MKVIFIVFMLFPFFTQAQDCNLKNEKDQFNQDPRLTTGFKSMGAGNDKFLFSISADKTEVDVFFSLENTGLCFNDYSRAVVIFEGKSKGTYKNGGTTNCKGYFHFIFRNQDPTLTPLINLTTKKAISIQFTASDFKTKKEITLQPADQEQLKAMATCVVNELANLRTDTWKPGQKH